VLDALGRLSEEQRIVFLLKVVEGYTHEEIARQLGIRRGTSEVRLFRAIRQLRELLGRD
jgi:RNA polymerase sigma-70 factor (ECF subfamily)